MSTHKTAEKPDAKADKTPTGVKRAKPFDATKPPPMKGGEVDTAKLKELRREKPDEAPALPGETGTGKPAMVWPAPHVGGVPHPAGEDPEETEEKMEAAGADTETPFPDTQAQALYGLRKEGRLYRARCAGHATLLIEADDEKCAKEAAIAEFKRVAGEETKEQKKAKKGKEGEGLPAMPPGFVGVPVGALGVEAPAPINANTVKVTKLAP